MLKRNKALGSTSTWCLCSRSNQVSGASKATSGRWRLSNSLRPTF